jgi:transposase
LVGFEADQRFMMAFYQMNVPVPLQLCKKRGHTALPLPPYSPDFNPIENSFGTLKTKRQFAPPDTTIIDIVKSSDFYLE